jgi:hypothetical protein
MLETGPIWRFVVAVSFRAVGMDSARPSCRYSTEMEPRRSVSGRRRILGQRDSRPMGCGFERRGVAYMHCVGYSAWERLGRFLVSEHRELEGGGDRSPWERPARSCEWHLKHGGFLREVLVPNAQGCACEPDVGSGNQH